MSVIVRRSVRASKASPKPLEKLSGCQQVFILPHGFKFREPSQGIQWRTFFDIRSRIDDFDEMRNLVPTFEDYVIGHPGYTGGIPVMPAGHGITFGVKDYNDTEWWLTEAEGLADSAEWEAQMAEPTSSDGAWLLGVRGKQRSIMLRGVAIGQTKESATKSLSEAASALSVAPRTGWLTWTDATDTERRLPVVMSARLKAEWKSQVRFDVEVQVTGINLGSPGKGVFMESTPVWHSIDKLHNSYVVVEGTVPSPARVVVAGPVDAGLTMDIDQYRLTVNDEVPDGAVLVIDTADHSVIFDGEPRRAMVSFKEEVWPMLAPGAVNVTSTWTGTGKVDLIVTDLW